MNQPWKIIEETIYEQFRIFSAKRSKRINPRNGKPFDFFLMEGFDWVNLILLTPKTEIVLVQQYRHGAERLTLELPGGTVEPGEDPSLTAIREAKEETGFTVKEIRKLGAVYANPAMQSMKLHVFVGQTDNASDIPNTQSLDSGEDIKVIVKPLAEFLEDVKHGRAEHALTVAAVGMYLLDNAPK